MSETDIIAVQEKDKMVVLEIPPHDGREVMRVVLDPPTALAFANAVAQSAYTGEHGVHPENALKTAATNEKYIRMANRVKIMLGGKRGKPNEKMAKEICDVVFAELL